MRNPFSFNSGPGLGLFLGRPHSEQPVDRRHGLGAIGIDDRQAEPSVALLAIEFHRSVEHEQLLAVLAQAPESTGSPLHNEG